MNRIENEFLNIRRDNNGTGAALSNKIGKPDPCIDFFQENISRILMQTNKDPELKEMKREYEASAAERKRREEKVAEKKALLDTKFTKIEPDPVI
jgi:hypothetical protein